jgi:phosphatidylserine/phosphatidylglycerophosphate/cardiolipin synthase-like enzyme
VETFSSNLLEQVRRVAQEVPSSTLDALIQALMTVNQGELTKMRNNLLQLLPRASWRQMFNHLIEIWQAETSDLDGRTVAIALSTAVHCQTQMRQELSVELVWTGPNPESFPLRRTDQTLLQLIRDARQDLLIVSFAIYNIPEIVQALIAALDRGVNIRIVAETPEASDGKISFGLSSTFGAEVLRRSQLYVWLKAKRPVDEQGRHGSLHAKCAVSDRQRLFISSANLTEYAMSLNMEMGVLIQNRSLAQQVIQQIESLISHKSLTLWQP